MKGRAGRKGKDVMGETYLICQKADLEAISGIWEAETPAIESCLGQDNNAVQRYDVFICLALKVLTTEGHYWKPSQPRWYQAVRRYWTT